MIRKKIDSRVRTIVENGVNLRHRTMFVIVGDRGRDQIVNLHYMLTKAQTKARPSVLWCYKKELGFTTHKHKRMREVKRKIQRGQAEAGKEDPFDLFISSTDIRYTYYSDTQKILGNTYGMCVLQDFEALTPNLLARTVETVEGGGLIVLLLRTMKSLKQLYTLSMDVHGRFRTESHADVQPRFNERFILSLATCQTCLVVDDALNVLPISSHCLSIEPVANAPETREETKRAAELRDLKVAMADTQPAGALVSTARTMDQAKAILTFVEAISEKTLRSTVTLTAARGRGKSAALGVAMAAAVAYGYSNIFVTSPSPENLKTLFEFVCKGFDALDMQEHTHYELVQSTNPELNKAVIRINVFRTHRQTIHYIHPRDAAKLTHAELLVIDEAAAIPLPFVQALMGPYLVFMASTINGYEGTGRSLSLKLIQKLRQQSATSSQQGASVTARTLREITLHEPIRYGLHDPIERWLYRVLCLDAATESANAPLGKTLSAGACPPPARCELFYINRDTLFSFHKASEDFLQRLMALYVSAHYKNTPNDLQLMSDAPAHHLFCLLGPVDPNEAALPEVLCVVQVCIEGEISRQTMASSLARGVRASGDLIPWMISQQFQDNEFASLSGARIVRIATHPDYSGMGYGTRALALLQKYYQGDIMGDLAEGAGSASATSKTSTSSNGSEGSSLLDERLVPRRHSAPLLSRLAERPAERLHYLGVSYGMTKQLYRFWKKNGFTPVYLRQTTNELTGEHSCIMLRELAVDPLRMTVSAPENWLNSYWLDFRKRFVSLLSISFRSFSTSTALSILERSGDASLKLAEDSVDLDASDVRRLFTVYDVKRLETYAANLVDYHIVLDLVPQLARLWFLRQLNASLTAVQCSILLGIGLQAKSIDDLEKELNLPSAQLMALFNKTVRKLTQKLRSAFEEEIAARLPTLAKQREQEVEMEPLRESVDDELSKAGESVPESTTTTSTASKGPKLPFSDAVSLSQYAIDGTDEAWTEALATGSASVVSVKGEKRKKRLENEAERNSDLKRLRKSEEDTGISGYVPKKKKSKSKK